jgi:hypothetical protein
VVPSAPPYSDGAVVIDSNVFASAILARFGVTHLTQFNLHSAVSAKGNLVVLCRAFFVSLCLFMLKIWLS